MNTKEILKWGLIVVLAFVAWRWFSSILNYGQGVVSAGTIYGGWPYAAPLPGPNAIRTPAWSAGWNRGGNYYGRGRRHMCG